MAKKTKKKELENPLDVVEETEEVSAPEIVPDQKPDEKPAKTRKRKRSENPADFQFALFVGRGLKAEGFFTTKKEVADYIRELSPEKSSKAFVAPLLPVKVKTSVSLPDFQG